jgi:hypothetical protein
MKRGKHRTEDTEVTEEGWGLVDKRAPVNNGGFRARRREPDKHRTEVTEAAEEGFGVSFGSRTCSQILQLLNSCNSCCHR